MGFLREIKRRAKASVPPLVFLSLAGYFGWSATQGDRGLQAYAARQEELKGLRAELATAEAGRDTMERRVASLRSNGLDTDALEERARALWNLSEPNDVVVQYPPGKRLF